MLASDIEIAYTFELTQMGHTEKVASRSVQLSSAHSLHDLHLTILKAFGWEKDEDFDEWYADWPYAFYMNNNPDDLSSAFVSANFTAELQEMDQGMTDFLFALADLPQQTMTKLRAAQPQPEPATKPAGLATHTKLSNLNLLDQHQFVYDLGECSAKIVAIKLSQFEPLPADLKTLPRILQRRKNKSRF